MYFIFYTKCSYFHFPLIQLEILLNLPPRDGDIPGVHWYQSSSADRLRLAVAFQHVNITITDRKILNENIVSLLLNCLLVTSPNISLLTHIL